MDLYHSIAPLEPTTHNKKERKAQKLKVQEREREMKGKKDKAIYFLAPVSSSCTRTLLLCIIDQKCFIFCAST